jgi:hypothetical protein
MRWWRSHPTYKKGQSSARTAKPNYVHWILNKRTGLILNNPASRGYLSGDSSGCHSRKRTGRLLSIPRWMGQEAHTNNSDLKYQESLFSKETVYFKGH